MGELVTRAGTWRRHSCLPCPHSQGHQKSALETKDLPDLFLVSFFRLVPQTRVDGFCGHVFFTGIAHSTHVSARVRAPQRRGLPVGEGPTRTVDG